LIDWCLTPTLAVFQIYRGVNKFPVDLDTEKAIRNKTYLFIKQTGDMYKYKKH